MNQLVQCIAQYSISLKLKLKSEYTLTLDKTVACYLDTVEPLFYD